jgi:hypothetical protein
MSKKINEDTSDLLIEHSPEHHNKFIKVLPLKDVYNATYIALQRGRRSS